MIRLAIRVRVDCAEMALADLLPVLGAGAEERAVTGAIEYATYGADGELPGDAAIRALAGDAVLEIVREPVADGWERRWHEFLRPVRAGELVVRPPWIDGAPEDLVIDPGTSFGAGTHPTTRLCLQLLQAVEPGGPLCDWGAGTGVLAIAAARLGWAPVTAVELDAGTIGANAARNGVDVEVVVADLRDGPPWAPTVVANLTRPLLHEMAARRPPEPTVERPPERMIVSGFLAGEDVPTFGLDERQRLEEDGWAAVVLA